MVMAPDLLPLVEEALAVASKQEGEAGEVVAEGAGVVCVASGERPQGCAELAVVGG
jgi:hypothetical protein